MDFDDLEEAEDRHGVLYESFADQLPEVRRKQQQELAQARREEKEAVTTAQLQARLEAEHRRLRQELKRREAVELSEQWEVTKATPSKAEENKRKVQEMLAQVPKTLSKQSDAQSKSFTLREAIDLEDELIAEYSKPDFQANLHAAWDAAGEDPEAQFWARQALCLQIQIPIIAKYGFEASRRGVAHSVYASAQFQGHHDIVWRSRALDLLVDPARQREAPQVGPEELRACASDLAEHGWVHVPRLGVATGLLDQVQVDISNAQANLRPGQCNGSEVTFRTDSRTFLDMSPLGMQGTPGLQRLVEVLVEYVRKVGAVLNGSPDGPRLELGTHCSPMLARYCYGGRYIPHIDNGNRDGRVLTLVYYLNRGWDESWGGALRLYPNASRSALVSGLLADLPSVAVVPEEDTAVLFRADYLVHEVEFTEREAAERYALTLWFNGECFFGPFLPLEPS